MRVADLNYIQGPISMQPAGAADWSPAPVNRPFTTGDNLWVDSGGQAELHLNDAVLRCGDQTSIGFLNLNDHIVQVRFTQGELILRVQQPLPDDTFEVDTPNAAITIFGDGEYRFNADPNSATTWVVVRRGQAQITGGGQTFPLNAGNSAQLTGTDQLTYNVEYAPAPDGLEAWSEDRDAREARLMSARYLPPGVIGYEELDAYGTWRDTPGYGAVWYPSVDAAWAPYTVGHWAWIEPWGWTWVDDAAWGFAPSHYGRWAYLNGGWGWVPGPLLIAGGGPPPMAPVYAPALVAFFGGGGFGMSLSLGGGAVGWVPLGPGEVYTPAYQVSANYFRVVNVSSTRIVNVNITNVYNTVYVNKTLTNVAINQHFANMTAPHAFVAVPQNAFAAGSPVRQVAVAVSASQIAQIRPTAVAVALPVAPTRQALSPLAGTRPAATPPARAMNVAVVAKATPPPPPVPFAAKQAALQQSAGHIIDAPAIRQSVPQPRPAQTVHVAPPARAVTPHVQATTPRPPQNTPPAAQPNYRPPQNPVPAAQPGYRPPQSTPPSTYKPPSNTPQSQQQKTQQQQKQTQKLKKEKEEEKPK